MDYPTEPLSQTQREVFERILNEYEPYAESTPGIDDFDSGLDEKRLAATFAKRILDSAKES